MINAKITGVGGYVPEKVYDNAYMESIVDTNDEWITRRTGIKERHISADNEYTTDMATIAAKRAIENAGLFPDLSGYKNLKLLAGIKKKISKDKIRETISEVGLDPDDKRPIRKYSLGMRQRILIAQAIMEEPDVLLLDEPTNGLDDSGVDEIRKLISAQAKRGAIVCVASHNKEDIALLSDKIFRVDNGAVREE